MGGTKWTLPERGTIARPEKLLTQYDSCGFEVGERDSADDDEVEVEKARSESRVLRLKPLAVIVAWQAEELHVISTPSLGALDDLTPFHPHPSCLLTKFSSVFSAQQLLTPCSLYFQSPVKLSSIPQRWQYRSMEVWSTLSPLMSQASSTLHLRSRICFNAARAMYEYVGGMPSTICVPVSELDEAISVSAISITIFETVSRAFCDFSCHSSRDLYVAVVSCGSRSMICQCNANIALIKTS